MAVSRTAVSVCIVAVVTAAAMTKLFWSAWHGSTLGWLFVVAFGLFWTVRLVAGKSATLGFAVVTAGASKAERGFAVVIWLCVVALGLIMV